MLMLLGTAALAPTSAWAQEAASPVALPPAGAAAPAAPTPLPAASPASPDAPSSDTTIRDIIITGSRIQRNGYDNPTPTTTVGQELLTARAPATIIDALATLPSFKGNGTTGSNTNASGGNLGQSFVNLRGLGANRTLVLLNSQRIVPSNGDGTVDVSILPSSLLSRIDVVTGGASAAYGSDAVAGVVNFVLDTGFRGIRGDVQTGIASQGDGALKRATLTAGHALTDRLSILVSGEYYENKGVYPQTRRQTVTQLIANPAYVAGNGQYRLTLQPNVYASNATFGGLILSGPLRGQQFNRDGSLSPQLPGTYVNASTYSLPGEADLPFVSRTSYFAAPQERKTGFGRLGYQLSDDIEVHGDALYARSDTTIASAEPTTVVIQPLTIQSSNPFLPTAVRNQLAAANVTSFTFGRASRDLGPGRIHRANKTLRFSAGLTAKLGAGWSLDAYGSHGENRARTDISNLLISGRYREAIDATISNGQIVCRSSLTNPGNGCVPINQFGEQASYTDAQRAYILGISTARLKYVQDVAGLTLNGEPFSTWAGPVSVAGGGEYRRERATQTVDALSAASAFQVGNPKPLNGLIRVKEGFFETAIPLAKDMTLLRSLDLNGAVRVTDYSTSGTVVTWKAGATYTPIDGVKFRVTRSRDIRAPNIIELFSSTVQSTAPNINDQQTKSTVSFVLLSRGNPALKPEIAETFSGGVVVKPSFLPGFSASVDYYDIKIKNAIATLTAQNIVNQCFAGDQNICRLITRDANGTITNAVSQYLNLASVKTRGVDIDASYRRSLGQIFGGSQSGIVSLRAIGSYLDLYRQNNGVVTLDTTGSIVAGQPKWSWTWIAGFEDKRFSTFATVTRLGGGKYDSTLTGAFDISPSDQSVPSVTYLDLAVAFKVPVSSGFVELYMNMNNVFDKKPPAYFGYSGVSTVLNYDRVGRYFKAGARFRF